jgi:hypothetical protein
MPYFKNDNVNILFIHIPKTGGSSLELYFCNKFNIPLNDKSLYMLLDEKNKNNTIEIDTSLQHMTYNTIMKNKEYFNIKFEDLKIITIVRNPYERIISDLFYYFKIYINTTPAEVFIIMKKYLYEKLDNHTIPQYFFITQNKKLIPNISILHTETLKSDMIKLGYTDFDMHDNCNKVKVNYYNYLNSDSIKLINKLYHYDFLLFNYTQIYVKNKTKHLIYF